MESIHQRVSPNNFRFFCVFLRCIGLSDTQSSVEGAVNVMSLCVCCMAHHASLSLVDNVSQCLSIWQTSWQREPKLEPMHMNKH